MGLQNACGVVRYVVEGVLGVVAGRPWLQGARRPVATGDAGCFYALETF